MFKIGRFAGALFLVSLTVAEAQETAPGPASTNAPVGALMRNDSQPVANPLLVPEKSEATSATARNNSELSHDIAQLCEQKLYDNAVDKLDDALQANPRDLLALDLRGYVYSRMQQWDLARKDFEAMLQVNDKLASARFNLVELKFLQKNYTEARAGFSELEGDADIGDLATYKVFLCDLFGRDMHRAKEELEAFDLVGLNPSYYFSNAAWELYHQHPDAARPWLDSAGRIYYPGKLENYSRSLFDLGYLPLPPPALK